MTIFKNILEWAIDRGLDNPNNIQSQMLKMTEEVGELASAIGKSNRHEAIDAIGDCVVVLTIIASQLNCDIESCISLAYEEIKDRKGRLVNGVFIKDIT